MDNTIHDDLLPYKSLSPVANADTDGNYSKMLRWALENRDKEDIKNIALTGPYGSGKSSILKTFQAQNKNEDLEFLNISLATFKEELEDNQAPATAEAKQTLLRLIELSILQQIFYHEKDEDIPDTRFKKTRSFPEENAVNLSWNIFFFIISAVYLFYSTEIWNAFNVTLRTDTAGILNMFALFTVLWMGYQFIRQSIRPLRSIQLKKLNFQQAEFAVDEKISKSILNEHLDEILYFFEVTKYTVVVFEDLDRFQQTEIFTKLRELNHLINYSKKMNGRKVAFIYAVRDEMFQDRDRTKFFDFIVPVIPVVNSTNSNEILRNIVKDNEYDIKEDLLDNIALYVDDMRLLYNIMNEYYLYHKKLDKKLDQNKLLGILVYKNIYPNDFVDLSNNKGILFNTIRKKDSFIITKELEFNKKIKKIQAKIVTLQGLGINNADELRKLYVLGFLQAYPEATSFRWNDKEYAFNRLHEEPIFTLLIDDTFQKHYGYYDSYYGRTKYREFSTSLEKIETLVSPGKTYKDRLLEIQDITEGKIDVLKEEIKDIENQLNSVKHTPINVLLKKDLVEVKVEDEGQKLLISVLLRGDYINESYQDYLSIFYEGSLTRSDRDFILSVKGHNRTAYDVPLHSICKIVEKIPEYEFESNYILNYSLLDFLLNDTGSEPYLAKIINVLSNGSELSINFIDGYIDYTVNESSFIQTLARKWSEIWKYIGDRDSFTKERKNFYLKLILEHVDFTDLQKIGNSSKLLKYLEQKSDLLYFISDEEKLKKIIEKFELKFELLDLPNAPVSLIDFVFENNYYVINISNIETWLRYKGVYVEEEFKIMNYSLIRRNNKKLETLSKYVYDHLNKYITNVWLMLEGDKRESPDYFWQIIDKHDLSIELKRDVLERNLRKFENFDEFTKTEHMQLLLQMNQVIPTWKNLHQFYKQNSSLLSDDMVQFINQPDNANLLCAVDLDYNEEDEDEVKIVKSFARQIVLCENISNECYGELINRLPWRYVDLDFSELSAKKVEMAISVLSVTKENYERLRDNFPYLHIKLLEKSPSKVIENLSDFTMDEHDVESLLASSRFSVERKNIILRQLSDESIIANVKLLLKVGALAAENNGLEISKEIIKAVLKSSLSSFKKVALLNKNIGDFNKNEIFEVLQFFGKGYEDIKLNGKQAVIDSIEENWNLALEMYKRGHIYEPKPDKKGIRIRNKKN